MARKHYTEEKIAHSLAVLRSNGGNLKRTSDQTGVTRSTLRAWQSGQLPEQMDPEVIKDTQDAISRKIVEQFADIATLSLEAAKAKIPEASYRDLLIGAGIATEKRELLGGRPTARTESLKVSLIVPGSLKLMGAQVLSGQPIEATTVRPLPDPDVIEGEVTNAQDKDPI